MLPPRPSNRGIYDAAERTDHTMNFVTIGQSNHLVVREIDCVPVSSQVLERGNLKHETAGALTETIPDLKDIPGLDFRYLH